MRVSDSIHENTKSSGRANFKTIGNTSNATMLGARQYHYE